MGEANMIHLQRALSGAVVPSIGQIGKDERRAFAKAVKAGRLVKWTGAFFPISGAPVGLYPFKTCYSTSNPFTEPETVESDPCPTCHDADCGGCVTGYSDSAQDRDSEMRVKAWRKRAER